MKNFVQLPIFNLISYIRYKAEREGLEVIETEESYTSGTSALDNENPIEQFYNIKRRKTRGLFKSNNGRLLNSDVNSAFQIIKKVHRDVILPTVNGLVFNPVRLYV